MIKATLKSTQLVRNESRLIPWVQHTCSSYYHANCCYDRVSKHIHTHTHASTRKHASTRAHAHAPLQLQARTWSWLIAGFVCPPEPFLPADITLDDKPLVIQTNTAKQLYRGSDFPGITRVLQGAVLL
eukprot:1153476-Pelagomonas_calceolata.AAC.3